MELSPSKFTHSPEGRKSARVPENINEDYQMKALSIQHAIRGYREIKQDIFLPDQLLQILDMKVSSWSRAAMINFTEKFTSWSDIFTL